MKKSILKCTIVFAFLMGFVSLINNINTTFAATSGDFVIKPEDGDGAKVNIDGGFYLIKANPGEVVQVKVGIFNTDKHERRFLVSANTAYTDDSGQPAYNAKKVKDPNLKVKVRDTVQNNDQIITVAGNSDTSATLNIKIPEQKYNGFIMGGVNVTPYKEEAKGTVTENGTLIKNKFSYSLPIQIGQNGSDNADVNYKISKVFPTIVPSPGKKEIGVSAVVMNTKNAYIPNLSSKAVITKYGNSKFKKTTVQDNQSIAPTSHYNYPVSWGKDRLQTGKYHIKLTYNGSGIKSWVVDKDFIITNAQADKFNNLAGFKPNYMWLWIILGILLLLLILGLGLYLGKRNNNNNSNNNNRLSSKSRRRRRR
ncbi:WxL protein host-binding domain-containing protein [Companilactobacillus furfuricola]|uniref:WxL protein host-binding domain-containing protein n=1 Tax=Companilactobacillus furfuricola TaxID=1462575 RepID=UPI000F77569E|nr:DUF3324 domain-containing protein [Companilactobacillus furfuricola]